MDAAQLRQLMPKNAGDVESAKEVVALGASELAPVVPEMLRQLKTLGSPVSNTFAEFFAESGEPFAGEIGRVLSRSTMPEVKWVILSKILPSWSTEAIRSLHGTLGMLMSAADFFGTDLWCIRLLAKHSIGERHALEAWLEFKRNRLRTLSQMAAEVANEMGLGDSDAAAS